MHRLLRLLLYFFLLLLFIASIAFSLLNRIPVPLSFGVFELQPQAVSVWVIGAFCIGGLCGVLLSSGFYRGPRKARQHDKR